MDTEMEKYAHLIVSMSTDFLMGGITEATYKQNLRIALKNMKGNEVAGSEATQ